jgi:hypothetical protein
MLQIISTKILLLYNDIKNNQKDQKKIHTQVRKSLPVPRYTSNNTLFQF